MEEKFLTVKEVAARWRVDPSTVYRKTLSGKIPHFRVGKCVRYRTDLIKQFEDKNTHRGG